MPNRVIREGILTSERVNSLSSEVEVFYRRLMSVVDDFGRYTAHPALLRAALYPLQLEQVREASMERHLAKCEQARLVRLYVVSSKRYVELLNFGQHVRAQKSKWPAPESDCAIDALHQNCISHTDALGDGDGDGDENSSSTGVDVDAVGGEETERKPPEPTAFERFWKAYPRRVGKVPAQKAFLKHGCAARMEVILASLEKQKATEQWQREGGQFIPHPSTWLNRHGWEDELRPVVAVKPTVAPVSRYKPTTHNEDAAIPPGYRMQPSGQWEKQNKIDGRWFPTPPPMRDAA